jgi:diacylglycerol kinase (ATP)
MSVHKNQTFRARLGFALQGLAHGVASERSLRLQLGALAAVVVALLALHPGALWWALALLAGAGVLAAELLNTAIERLADHLHPEVHPGIRVAKDCAAAGVLLAALGALAVAVALAVHLLARG